MRHRISTIGGFGYFCLLFSFISLGLLTSACSDLASEFASGFDNDLDKDSSTLRVNILKNTTRSLNDPEELKINVFCLIAFPCTEDGGKDASRDVVYVKVDRTENGAQDNSEELKFDVKGFSNGYYRIYSFANIEDYIEKPLSPEILEEDVRKLVLDYSLKVPSYGNLPMACTDTEIRTSKNSEPVAGGLYRFDDNNKEIYVLLTIQCTKVRYTILYDKDSFSKLLSDNVDVEVEVKNVRKQTAIMPKGKASEDMLNDGQTQNFFYKPLARVAYPEEGSNYLPNDNAGISYEEDLDVLKKGEYSTDSHQRAWQCILYLPENTLAGKETKLVTRKLNEENETYEPQISTDNNLIRGDFYSVTTALTTPSAEDINSATTYKYRIYWPITHGPGLYIEGLDESEDEYYEAMNRGKEKEGDCYYYFDFTCYNEENAPTYKVQFNNLKGTGANNNTNRSNIKNLNLEKDFRKAVVNGEIVKIGYIEVFGNDPDKITPGYPLNFHNGDNIYFYWNKNLRNNGSDLTYAKLWGDNWTSGDDTLLYYHNVSDKTNYNLYIVTYFGQNEINSMTYQLSNTTSGSYLTNIYSFSTFDATLIPDNGQRFWYIYIDEL